MFKYVIIILLYLFIYIPVKAYSPEKIIYIARPETPAKFPASDIEKLESVVGYKLPEIKYLKIYTYHNKKLKSLPANTWKLKLIITKFRNPTNFLLIPVITGKDSYATSIEVKNKNYFQKVASRIKEFIKEKLPLEGMVVTYDKKKVIANFGEIHGVKKGMKFFVEYSNIPVASCMALKVKKYTTELVILKQKGGINYNYRVVEYSYTEAEKFNKLYGTQPINKPVLFPFQSSKFKVFPCGNLVFISTDKYSGIYNVITGEYIILDNFDYTKIKNASFSPYKSFLAYQLNTGKLYLYNIQNKKKYYIAWNKINDKYFLSENDKENLPLKISCFSFYDDNNLCFLPGNSFTVYNLNLTTFKIKKFLNIEEKLNFHKFWFSANKDFIIFKSDKGLLIKSTVNLTEKFIRAEKYSIPFSEGEVYYLNNRVLYYYNFYLNNAKKLKKINFEPDKMHISFSERYILFLKKGYLNSISIYDIKENRLQRDIFLKGKKKNIRRVFWIPERGKLLIYGRLIDNDKNNKIDYRDIFYAGIFDLFTEKINLIYKNYTKVYDFNYGILWAEKKKKLYGLPVK